MLPSCARNHILYNGNISTWTNSYRQGGVASVTGEQYSYDMLNRITASKYNNLAAGTATPTPKFATSYSYDLNGNIEQLNRSGNNASGTEPDMDKLDYRYMPGTNKLKAIKDVIDDDIYENVDVDNQVPDVEVNDPEKVKKETNYTYDDIGNLKEDKQAGVTIKWTVYGKVAEVVPMAGSGKPHVKYTYDAAGNRIAKQVNRAPQDNNPSAITTTYYLRDASGNTMAVYERNIAELGRPAGVSKPNGPQRVVANSHKAVYIQREVSLYGSDRLGIYKPDVNTPLAEVPFSNLWAANLPAVAPTTPAAELLATRTVGLKEYELKDHLGNVRAVVTDAKVGTAQTYYDALVNGSNTYQYYPFGMLMPGTGSASGETAYRYGYNGKEKDADMGNDLYDFGGREYNSKIGRWWSPDPLERLFPNVSPFVAFINNPIIFTDPDGEKVKPMSSEAFDIIVATLPPQTQSLIARDNDGYISLESITAAQKVCTSDNLEALAVCVKTNRIIEVYVDQPGYSYLDTKTGETLPFTFVEPNRDDVFENELKKYDPKTMGNIMSYDDYRKHLLKIGYSPNDEAGGNYGTALRPKDVQDTYPGGQATTDNTYKVYINPVKTTRMEKVVKMAHELFGHIYTGLIGKDPRHFHDKELDDRMDVVEGEAKKNFNAK